MIENEDEVDAHPEDDDADMEQGTGMVNGEKGWKVVSLDESGITSKSMSL